MPGYLGNKSDSLVHHLAAMTPDCRIVEIKNEKVDALLALKTAILAQELQPPQSEAA